MVSPCDWVFVVRVEFDGDFGGWLLVPAVTSSISLSESAFGLATGSAANAAVDRTDPTISAMICFFISISFGLKKNSGMCRSLSYYPNPRENLRRKT
jgi:hypothetical protein